MAIIRLAPRTHFTQIPNDTLRDTSLSLKAKGLLSLMLSYPDDWEFNFVHLVGMSTDGRDATYSAFNELLRAGYARREQKRRPDGTLGEVEIVVYAEAVRDANPPLPGFPDTAEPDTDNPSLRRTTTRRTRDEVKPSSAFADGSEQQKLISEEGMPASPSPSTQPSPTERARAKKENDASRILELRDAWNANCGTLPKITAVNPKRERYFRRLIKEAEAAGIDPVNAMSVVAATVAQNDYYQQKRYNVEHALSDGKWLKHYETGVARGLGPQEAIDHGFVKGQLVRWLIDPRFPKQGHNMGIFLGVNERGLAQVECKAGDTTVIRTPRLELLEAADEPA